MHNSKFPCSKAQVLENKGSVNIIPSQVDKHPIDRKKKAIVLFYSMIHRQNDTGIHVYVQSIHEHVPNCLL